MNEPLTEDEPFMEDMEEENVKASDLQALLEQVEQLESLGQKSEEHETPQDFPTQNFVDQNLNEPVGKELSSALAPLKEEYTTESEEEGKAWKKEQNPS